MLEERAGVKQSFNVEAKVAHLLARYGVRLRIGLMAHRPWVHSRHLRTDNIVKIAISDAGVALFNCLIF